VPHFDAQTLQTFSAQLLQAGGATANDAEVVSESLIQANLRGHDSHGIMRIPSYLENVSNGRIQPGQSLEIIKEAPAVIVGDGGWGFGQVISHELMNRLMEKASSQGIASGTLRQTAHIGRLGEYAELAASHHLASLIIANTHGAAHRVAPVGTNPICMGMPGGQAGPFVMDFGTSATAEGKVRVKRIAGEQVPPGLILDSEGRPSTDPHVIYGDPPGTILPMGGNQAYKGFGLAYMIEMFSGGLSAGQCSYPTPPKPLGNCALFVLFDPELFGGLEHLKQEVSQLEEFVRSSPAIDPDKPVTLPGDPELRTLELRQKSGIPLDAGNWQALTELAEKLGVKAPVEES